MPVVWARPMDSMVGWPSEANDGNFAWWGTGVPAQYQAQFPAPLGTGSKAPQDFWYFYDPWMVEYRSTLGAGGFGWPPPQPGSGQYYDTYGQGGGSTNWVDFAIDWAPYGSWPYNSIVGGYNQPQNNRVQWVKPDWTAEADWPQVDTINSVRVDCILGPHRWVTGTPSDENEIYEWAFTIGLYEAQQDYPTEPGSWQASRYRGTATTVIGPAGGFRYRHFWVSIPAWGGLSKSDLENRVYGICHWRSTSTPRSNVELRKMWFGVDATLTATVPPGTGPGVATLSNVG